MTLDPANTEQARAWEGDQGARWAEHAERFDRTLARYHETLMSAAAIVENDRVLDIGCGTGQATLDAARRTRGGSAVGIDLSGRMLEVARRRAAAGNIVNVSFVHADAQLYPFEARSFDVAFSRTGSMFFADPLAAFANIARALRPGGRLVLLTWQQPDRDDWFPAIARALSVGRPPPVPPIGAPGPFGQADPEQVRMVLTSAGFSHITVEGLREPMEFGSDPVDAEAFVLELFGWMLEGLDDGRRTRALSDLRELLRANAHPDGVLMPTAAWLFGAVRT